MPVAFENFTYSFKNDKGKPVFVPTEYGRKIADEIRQLVDERFSFESYYYHFGKGAHIAALHAHREHQFFARLDLKNFFYSVSRNRVKIALKDIGVPRAEHYAKWSTVRNPYEDPRYSLPYGFPQSPLLATLALRKSILGQAIDGLPPHIKRSVYLDDIAISANDRNELAAAFNTVKESATAANFTLNEQKLSEPAQEIDLFNCNLAHGTSVVSERRVAKFYDEASSDVGIAAFENYCASVSAGNN